MRNQDKYSITKREAFHKCRDDMGGMSIEAYQTTSEVGAKWSIRGEHYTIGNNIRFCPYCGDILPLLLEELG